MTLLPGSYATSPVLRPALLLALNGVTVATGLNPDGSLPAVVAVTSLSVPWGRSSLFDQAPPATAAVTLFATDPAWLVAQGNLIGKRLVLSYRLQDTTTGSDDTRVFFRGRVSAAAPELVTIFVPVRTVTGSVVRTPVRGVQVVLSATSDLTTLANRPIGQAPWPAETFAARRARLAALVTDVVGEVVTRPSFDTATAAPMDVDSKDALSLLQQLYVSCGGDRLSYQPNANRLSYITRRRWSLPARGLLVAAHLGPRAGSVWITGPLITPTDEQLGGPAMYVPGTIERVEGISRDVSSRLTRVQVSYFDAASTPTAYTSATVLRAVPGTDELAEGRRQLAVESLHTTAAAAGTLADTLADIAAHEGQQWHPGKLHWDTRLTGGGFDNAAQVEMLLGGVERNGVFFLNASDYPLLEVPPLFGILGGTIRYADGRWLVDIVPAPVELVTDTPVVQIQHLIAATTDAALADFHESVTLADLGFVSQGLDQPTIYPEP